MSLARLRAGADQAGSANNKDCFAELALKHDVRRVASTGSQVWVSCRDGSLQVYDESLKLIRTTALKDSPNEYVFRHVFRRIFECIL